MDKQLQTFLCNFLLNVQDTVDYDRTVRIMIDYNIHNAFIDELFEQMDCANIDTVNGVLEPDKTISAKERADKFT